MSSGKSRILITGAGGIVGSGIRPYLAEQFDEIVLLDIKPIADTAANETAILGSANDPACIRDAIAGVDGVVHLACAYGLTISLDETIETNYRGLVTLLDAFVAARCSHFVFASSHHGWGYYPRGTPVTTQDLPRPDGWYGISKVFGESALAHYADSHGFSATSLRIGNNAPAVEDERRTHMWMSFKDTAHAIALSLKSPHLGHKAVFATADCIVPFFDNSDLKALGFHTTDKPLDNLSSPSVANEKPSTGIFGEAVGGAYVEANFKGRIEDWRKSNES